MVIFMRGKIFVLILVFVSLIASGCSEKKTETAAPNGTNTSVPQAALTEPKENSNSAPGEVHVVRLVYPYNVMRPSALDIKTGDIVSWWSDKRQKPDYTLVSKEGLFPDKELDYSVPFNYTFSAPGTYLFSIKDLPEMNVTITVK